MNNEEIKAWADLLDTVNNNEVLIHGREDVIGYVSAVTPAQVSILRSALHSPQKFWKKNGKEVGRTDIWNSVSIAPLTPEKKAEILARNRRRNAEYKLKKIVEGNLFSFSIETLEAAIALLTKEASEAKV